FPTTRQEGARQLETREGQLGRRSFLAASSLALASAAAPSLGADEKAAKSAGNSKRANPIGISTYSFWRFLDDSKVPVDRCIEQSAAMGFDAVEILRMQMDGQERTASRLENSYLQKLKQAAFREGIPLCGYSIHQ